LLVLAAVGLSLSVAAFITNSGVSTLASAALPPNADGANFAERFFLSSRIADSAALQPLKRYVMAKTEPATTAREALASRWMPADFRASISDEDGSQIALPTIAAPAATPVTTSTSGIPLPRSRPSAADQLAPTTTQALALAAAPPEPAGRAVAAAEAFGHDAGPGDDGLAQHRREFVRQGPGPFALRLRRRDRRLRPQGARGLFAERHGV
jgi:hypothetical protein